MARVVYADPEKKVILKHEDLPATGEHEVRIRTKRSYISAGTELTTLQMGPVNMKRDVPVLPMGYSSAGEVIEVGSRVTHVKVGDRVSCIGQGAFHADEVLVAKNLVVPIPDAVSYAEAAPAAMMCFALEGLRKVHIDFGENVLILGAGPMGQIASQLAVASGAQVIMADLNERRLRFAVDGVETVLADDAGWKRIAERFAPVGVEAALLCFGGDGTAAYDRLKTVMSCGPDGVIQGRVAAPGGVTITLTLASSSGNLQIFSSAKAGPGYRDAVYEAGGDYPPGYVKWTVTRNVRTLLNAIARKQLHIAPLLTHEFAHEDALAAYQKLAERGTDAMMVTLKY